jgi:hypothetical protein
MAHRNLAGLDLARRIPWRLAPVAVLLVALAGCNTPPPTEPFPEIVWGQYPAYKFAGDHLEVVNAYVPSGQAPHLDTATPRTLIDSADRWAHDRLHPAGGAGWIALVVTDASVVEVPLEVQTGIAHTFDNQLNKRYDAHVAVRIEIHNARGYVDGQVTAEASSSRSVNQDSDQREISEAQYLVVQDAMLRLNQQLQTNIDAHLQSFLSP